MALRIEKEWRRFVQIIKGRVKRNLKSFITKGELLGKRGGEVISIPLSRLEIPRFHFDLNAQRGVGQGQGKLGAPLSRQEGEESGHGHGEAGNMSSPHALDVDVTLEEMIKMLGEELELPNIEPRGQRHVLTEINRFSSVKRTGPQGLLHFKRTYKKALQRELMSGTYRADHPSIVPIKEDFHYRSWKVVEKPTSKAAIIYMMDVSGSMGDEQKEIVRITSFWIDSWLRYQYGDLECRYIIHDASAKEVEQDTFYHTKESGGTLISSAYKMGCEITQRDYSGDDWNVYFFHFSDGDNWSGEDTKQCIELLRNRLLPSANLFCYGQVESRYGSGQFLKDLNEYLTHSANLIMVHIENKDAIYAAIKSFLGKGK
ncbi:MAG: DUF444 family protein [Deltaproteobacteria bacterium]|nr:DUF444 family protein [Deltaproteobacteria bacterium]